MRYITSIPDTDKAVNNRMMAAPTTNRMRAIPASSRVLGSLRAAVMQSAAAMIPATPNTTGLLS